MSNWHTRQSNFLETVLTSSEYTDNAWFLDNFRDRGKIDCVCPLHVQHILLQDMSIDCFLLTIRCYSRLFSFLLIVDNIFHLNGFLCVLCLFSALGYGVDTLQISSPPPPLFFVCVCVWRYAQVYQAVKATLTMRTLHRNSRKWQKP